MVDTTTEITLGRVSDTRATSQTVRYRERLTVPWWWWLLGLGLAALIAFEVNQGVPALPIWLPYAVLLPVAAVALVLLGNTQVRVVSGAGETELWVGNAHLPVSVVSRSAEVPRSAKSAALGRQLDPAAYVVHKAWVGPMVLLVLDDPDDPTPYWLISCRRPERVLSALRESQR
ncbi:membrane protein [Mycolicibacterium moriokaense]|uniref:Membrane protein n=1 Tax=Mycolicibacterium moriokaense TaxID=39691 RepID=A0AAD1M817_9MYCO|nr:membrane protein [Mycolicibacterium moriokaense]